MENKNFVNQVEFAKILGNKSKQYVTTLKKQNKLVFNSDGLVDVDKSLKLINKMSDPSKKNNGANSKKDFIKDIPKDIKGDLTEEEIKDILENEDPNDFNQSKSRKEYFLSKIAELNFLKESGKLIETELVELQYFNISRLLRDKILNIKYRVSSQLSIMSDPVEISNLLEKEFRLIFSELDQEIEKEIKELEEDKEQE